MNIDSTEFRRANAIRIKAIEASTKSGMIKRENFGKPTNQEKSRKDSKNSGENSGSFRQILQKMQEGRE